jgi:hypothetical protein
MVAEDGYTRAPRNPRLERQAGNRNDGLLVRTKSRLWPLNNVLALRPAVLSVNPAFPQGRYCAPSANSRLTGLFATAADSFVFPGRIDVNAARSKLQ